MRLCGACWDCRLLCYLWDLDSGLVVNSAWNMALPRAWLRLTRPCWTCCAEYPPLMERPNLPHYLHDIN